MLRKQISAALSALLFVCALPLAALAATPTATSFSTSVPANRQSVIQLQGADADGTSLTFATLSSPSHGALSNLNASTGYVVYTPTSGYTGADSFTYKVTSGGQDSSTATVTITVSNSKTTVTGTVVDASGNPRSGKVTFILTQQVVTPAGLVPAGTSVSASLSSSGAYSVQLYPSRGMNPQAYYQVWFADSASLNREVLGVYDVPLSATPVGLDGYKVTDTNLAARYTFASVAGLEALINAVANASIAQLVAESRTTGKLQYWDGSNLADSIISQSGATVTVAGSLNATGGLSAGGSISAGGTVTATGAMTAAGFNGITAANVPSLDAAKITTGTFVAARVPDLAASKITSGKFTDDRLPSTMDGKTLTGATLTTRTVTSPAVTGGTFSSPTISAVTLMGTTMAAAINASGTLTATAFVGNGAGITGLTGATGGVSNTGSTTIGADTDSDSVGVIDLQTQGVTRLRVENDGTVTAQAGRIYDKGALIFDPRAYGAVCDSSTTNDTTAFQSAWNAAKAAGGALLVPESTNGCKVGGAGVANYIFFADKPVTVVGRGARSILVIDDATPSTTDVFRIVPPVAAAAEALHNSPAGQQNSGYVFRDFTVVGQSDGGFGNTAPPAKGGRDTFRIDITASGSYFQGGRWSNVHLGFTNGRNFSFLNKASGACVNGDGIFDVLVENSTLYEGIAAECFGDSNKIVNNRFRGFKSALSVTEFVAGAGNMQFNGNNMTADGGVYVNGGDGHTVHRNFFELYKSGAAGTSGTIVRFDGSTNVSFNDNLFGIVGSANGTTKGLTLVSTVGATVDNNRFLLAPGVCNIDLSGTPDTIIGPSNRFDHPPGSVCSSSVANTATLAAYAGGKQAKLGDLFGAKYGLTSIYSGFTGENNSVLEISNGIAAKSLLSLTNTQPTAYAVWGGIFASNTSATGADDNTARIEFLNGATADSSIIRFRTRISGTDAFRWGIDEDGTWLSTNSTIQLGDPGAKPTCASGLRGRVWHDFGGAGVADTVEVCAKKSDDTYAWVALASVP